MVKECPVLRNGDYCTLIRFGEDLVQIPSIQKDAKTVKVEYKDGRYKVIKDNFKEEVAPEKPVEPEKVEDIKENIPKKTKRGKKKEIEETIIE